MFAILTVTHYCILFLPHTLVHKYSIAALFKELPTETSYFFSDSETNLNNKPNLR